MQNLFSITLRATRLEANVDREYFLTLDKDLFGKWCVAAIYGRYDAQGTIHMSSFETQEQAWTCIIAKLQRRAGACQRIGCQYRLTQVQASPKLASLLEKPIIQALRHSS